MFSRALLVMPEHDRRPMQRRKSAKIIRRAACLSIAAILTSGFTTAADAARRNHHHRDHHHHRLSGTAKHRAHKADLGGYEFEVIFEGPLVLTPDEEAGNRAAVEAAEHPGPAATHLEEETPMQPER
jgi:hypothetical protein